MAKISGTIVCVGGAMVMAFFKGPKLLNYTLGDLNMLLHSPAISKWVLGALCLVVSSSCWSLWLILQVISFTSERHFFTSERHFVAS